MSKDSESSEAVALQIKEQLRKYYPGTKVPLAPLPEGKTIEDVPPDFPTLVVFPVKFTQTGRYHEKLAGIAAKITLQQLSFDRNTGRPTLTGYSQLIGMLTQIILADLMDMVDECCVPRLSQVDPYHDVIPLVVEAWIKENFLGERINPWKRAMETLFEKSLGQKLSLSDVRSKLSSLAVTLLKTSSGDTKKDSPTTGGVTSSSGPISEQRTDSLVNSST